LLLDHLCEWQIGKFLPAKHNFFTVSFSQTFLLLLDVVQTRCGTGRHSSFLDFYYNLERLPLSYGDHHVVKKALIKAWRLTLNHGDSLWSYGGSLYRASQAHRGDVDTHSDNVDTQPAVIVAHPGVVELIPEL
jgi:hypothetical protein